MDFCVWSILESKACSLNHKSIDFLKGKLIQCWDEIQPEVIHAACNQVKDRVKRVVVVKDGHIEI